MRLKLVYSLVLFGALTSTVNASIFTWNNAPATGDQLQFHLRNWEPAPNDVISGDRLYGVGIIDSIVNITAGGNAWLPSATQEMTIVFKDYDLSSFGTILTDDSYTFGSTTQLSFTGGTVDVYIDNTPDVAPYPFGSAPTAGSNATPDATAGSTFSNDTLLLSLVGHVGIAGNFGSYTLQSTISPANSSGGGYFDVTGGPLAPYFDTNAQLAPNGSFADLSFRTTLDPSGGPSGTYAISSSDPIKSMYFAAPEPMSVLVWTVLIGAACAVTTVRRHCSV